MGWELAALKFVLYVCTVYWRGLAMSNYTMEQSAEAGLGIVRPWHCLVGAGHIGVISVGVALVLLGLYLPT
jgi:hypothetical protein